jgi:hypothetical protein
VVRSAAQSRKAERMPRAVRFDRFIWAAKKVRQTVRKHPVGCFRGNRDDVRTSAKSLISGAPDTIRTCDLCLRRADALHYAASFGMGLSTNRENRVLRVPATRQQALENAPFSRAFCCSRFNWKFRLWKRRGSAVEAAGGKSQRKIGEAGRGAMTQL